MSTIFVSSPFGFFGVFWSQIFEKKRKKTLEFVELGCGTLLSWFCFLESFINENERRFKIYAFLRGRKASRRNLIGT
jgi:hypothetical protein